VGGRRKGFHAALVHPDGRVELARFTTPQNAANWLRLREPRLTAIDGPRSPAGPGQRSRDCERVFAAAGICTIRYTPDRDGLDSNPDYYEWVERGLRLYAACAAVGLKTIECFPTASWTRWAGARGKRRRSAWTSEALSQISLTGLPKRTSQDDRDAIAAALTARDHLAGNTTSFGDIVVPNTKPRLERRRPH
jgi:predicted nuclease with RNAse H fold